MPGANIIPSGNGSRIPNGWWLCGIRITVLETNSSPGNKGRFLMEWGRFLWKHWSGRNKNICSLPAPIRLYPCAAQYICLRVRTPVEVLLRIVKNISSVAICWKVWKTASRWGGTVYRIRSAVGIYCRRRRCPIARPKPGRGSHGRSQHPETFINQILDDNKHQRIDDGMHTHLQAACPGILLMISSLMQNHL